MINTLFRTANTRKSTRVTFALPLVVGTFCTYIRIYLYLRSMYLQLLCKQIGNASSDDDPLRPQSEIHLRITLFSVWPYVEGPQMLDAVHPCSSQLFLLCMCFQSNPAVWRLSCQIDFRFLSVRFLNMTGLTNRVSAIILAKNWC